MGCKVLGLWVKGLNLPPFLVKMTANYGIMTANYGEMTSFQGLSPAPEVSFIRNRGNFHLQAVNFSSVKELRKATGSCRNGYQ